MGYNQINAVHVTINSGDFYIVKLRNRSHCLLLKVEAIKFWLIRSKKSLLTLDISFKLSISVHLITNEKIDCKGKFHEGPYCA